MVVIFTLPSFKVILCLVAVKLVQARFPIIVPIPDQVEDKIIDSGFPRSRE